MRFPLLPKHSFRRYTDISPDFLMARGIKFLMLDLDNTIAKYSEHSPSAAAVLWINDLKNNNLTLHFISNSKRVDRVEVFSAALEIDFIKNARKPSPNALLRAMETSAFTASESAFIGDQIFTDTLAANRADVMSILVRPLSLKNPLLLLRFVAETPFRILHALNKTFTKR